MKFVEFEEEKVGIAEVGEATGYGFVYGVLE